MKVVLAIAVLIALALLSAGVARRAMGNRLAALAVSGLWGAGLVGLLLGPDGAGLINQGTRDAPGTRELATPLTIVTLGWVGMMLGLQARRDVISRVPAPVWKCVRLDALATLCLWAPIAIAAAIFILPGATADARVAAALALTTAMFGWSSETRSLRPPGLEEAPAHERAVRAAGALSSILAIIIFGLGQFAIIGARRARLDPDSLVVGLAGGAVGLALTVVAGGMVGRLGLALAGRSRGNQLVAFLGTLTLVAGIAAKLGVSSLLAAGAVGAIIGSARGFGAREFERYLLGAEIAIATLLGLLLGVGSSIPFHGADVACIALIVIWRAIAKPRTAGSALAGETSDASVRVGAIRAHPIALAIGLSLILHTDAATASRLAGILLVSSIASDLIALALADRRNRAAARSAAASGSAAS